MRCHYAALRDDRWFLVLEWVGAPGIGKNLADYYLSDLADMDAPGRLAEIVRLGSDICDGLAYIHASGIVHGDLKPQNVLIDTNGRAKITDLGRGSRLIPAKAPGAARPHISRARAAPQPATPEYTAPELWEGRSAGAPADIYALGCILYELAAGRLPFQAQHRGDLAQWARLHRKHPPADAPDVPEPLRLLIADCLQKSRPVGPPRRRRYARGSRECSHPTSARCRRRLPDDRKGTTIREDTDGYPGSDLSCGGPCWPRPGGSRMPSSR